jgi:hypothetical protein
MYRGKGLSKFGLKHKGKRNTPEVLNKINIAHGRQ